MLSERLQGSLPRTTESNLREHYKAITLRSGKQLSSSLALAGDDDVSMQDKPARKEPELEIMEEEKVEGNQKSPVREYQCPTLLDLSKRRLISSLEILSDKRKLEDLGLVILNEECSAILQNKLSLKRRDRGSFIIPCIIGDLSISGALADLGASINLMPTTLFDK
ncbi:uncharacterized protein LOC125369288 [Ricinus communis]|uniref:uncharacterized protein LOC125369288 n=1 Tax=Ricinus communis TaxID=3988 RepID=UPI00201B2B9F|nr:uncharacterized protein LOC125369288 [Ricinus communis]